MRYCCLAALLVAGCSTSEPSPATPQGGMPNGAFRMKLARVIDRNGFEQPIPSATLLIPTDWSGEGTTQWNTKDYCSPVVTTFKAEGPEGHAFEVFADFNWKWADNTGALRMDYAQKQQAGFHACDVMPPMSAEAYLKKNLGRVRPDARIVGVEAMPQAMAALQEQGRAYEKEAARYGLRQQVRPDLVRARIVYSVNGRAMEEWIVVKTVSLAMAGPFGTTYNCSASAIAQRAPAGRLADAEKLFDAMLSTIRVQPEWQRRYDKVMGNIQQAEQQGVRDRSAINAQTAEDLRRITSQGYQARQQSQDRLYAQYSESIRGVESYRNPISGETVELSSQFSNAWVNDRGEYLLSDQPGFDPGVAFRENWTALQRGR